jgi:hypothetical protein
MEIVNMIRKYGDIREDGFIFERYRTNRLENGKPTEKW